MIQRKLIGYSTDKEWIQLEGNDIRRFAASISCTDPIHYDEATAKKAGFSGVVAPASMAASMGHHTKLTTMLEVHPKNVLHSEQTVELRRPLVAGDSFRIFSMITDVCERPVGSATTGFVTIEDRALDPKGKPLFAARRVLAVRGGFPRR